MEHIGNLTSGRKYHGQPQTCSDKPGLKIEWVAALFKRFESIWGDKWLNRVGNLEMLRVVTEDWSQALDGFTGDEIKRGIDTCRAKHTWPPSIAEFIEAARPNRDPFGIGYIPECYRRARDDNGQEVKKITSAASDETRINSLAECRDILRGKR